MTRSAHPHGRLRALRDLPVADRAIELRDHDVASVRREDVRRLAKERLPVERLAGLQQPDDLGLLGGLALRLEVARRADVGSRKPGEGLRLVELVAGRTGQRELVDVFSVVEGDRLADRLRRAMVGKQGDHPRGDRERKEERENGRRPAAATFGHRAFSGDVFRKVMRSPTSFSARIGHGMPSSWARRYIAGPCRHSAVAIVTAV